MTVRAKLALLAMMAVLTAACAGLLGLDDETALVDAGGHDGRSVDAARPRIDARDDVVETGGGGDAGGDPHDDATTASHDAGSDAHEDATTASHDAGHDADAGGGDVRTAADTGAPCATKTTDDSRGVYLVAGGASSGCGSRANPCGDLGAVLAASTASFQNGVVYVGPGTFVSSVQALPEEVSIVGGWSIANGMWTGSCDPNATPVIVQASAPAVFTIGSPSAPSTSTITLDTLHLVNAATPTEGESLYGILAVGSSTSSLALHDVTISVPAGGMGVLGGVGLPGEVTTQTGCGPADGGAPGAGADGGLAPTFSAAGCMPAPMGPAASSGFVGSSPPPVKACMTESTACTAAPACQPGPPTSVCATAQSGCGGGGGGGGRTGGGGGCSVGLYLWGESAVLTGGSVTAGNGGPGGVGGVGGAGAPGVARSTGAAAVYVVACAPIVAICVPEQTSFGVDAAAEVGQGGPGGNGGQGGGGRGGDSYAVYAGGGAVVTAGDASVLAAGEAGVGGAPNGSDGVAAIEN